MNEELKKLKLFYMKINMKKTIYILLLVFPILFVSCTERKIDIPKQRGYFRIDLPKKKYIRFKENFPYSFNFPTYSYIQIDTTPDAEPYWLNIQFPEFKATIHISYKNIKNNLNTFVEDAHFLAFKHDSKADAIKAEEFNYDDKNVHGLLFDIKGNAASLMQFYVTDSTNHFVRGALYFNVPPNKDSLAPVLKFIREDIIELISSFDWK